MPQPPNSSVSCSIRARRGCFGLLTPATAALWCGAWLATAQGFPAGADQPSENRSPLVTLGLNRKLRYQPYTPQGDIIPDFSCCGYGRGGVKLPEAQVK